MNSNNCEGIINSLYESAVECSESYEQMLQVSKTENGFINWNMLEDLQNTFTNLINSLIQLEESDPYFTNLLHIRTQFYHHLTLVYNTKDKLKINDVTITIVPMENQNNAKFDTPPSESNSSITHAPKKIKTETKSNYEAELKNNIEQTIIAPKSQGLCDIVGLNEVKTILKEVVVFPLIYPHLFTGIRKPWSKALLYGPPGTGKTKLVHSIAAEVDAKLYSVSNADLLSRWVGESEKLLRTLFQTCIKSKERSIIFFDEVDSFCRNRNSSEAEHSRRLKNEFLTQLSELDNLKENNIFFLAATNCPWDIDPAFIRRFNKRIYVPLPNRLTRLEMLRFFVKNVESSISPTKIDEILDKTDGFSGSDMTDLANTAAYQPIRELENATIWTITSDCKFMPTDIETPTTLKLSLSKIPSNKIAVREIAANDFYEALKYVSKTISDCDKQKYEQFTECFSNLKK